MIAGQLVEYAAALVAAEEGGPVWLLALGPAGGGAVYFGFWRYYRNTDKSHRFEHETRIDAQPVTGTDAKVGENNGTKSQQIQGDNHGDHRQRVERM